MRKKRLGFFTAPLHERQKFAGVHLSKDLRAKLKKRSLPGRKGDKVKVLRGKFKKKEGKIVSIDLKKPRVFVEGCVLKKQGGKEIMAPIHPSNLLLVELVKRTPKHKKQAAAPAPTAAPARGTVHDAVHSAALTPKL